MTHRQLLRTALAYAAAGWPVFPCGPDKHPLTTHGFRDATTDPAIISRLWWRWPAALIGTPTGRGFVVLDVDVRPDRNGFETLRQLGFETLPETRTARTPSGGCHFYFASPNPPIGCTAGTAGRGIGARLDWRGVGGYVVLPAPGTGYEWVSEAPLAPVPPAMLPHPAAPEVVGTAARCEVLSPYGEAALRSAATMILTAPNGEQEVTLNGQSYAIGRLAGAGDVPVELALDVLVTAARGLRSYDPRRPWRRGQAEAKVRVAFAAGLAKPRATTADVMAELDRIEAEAVDVE